MSKPKTDPLDVIRKAVVDRAAELGLTPYAVAKRTDGEVSADSLQRYWAGTVRLTDRKLAAVMRVLGLRVTVE